LNSRFLLLSAKFKLCEHFSARQAHSLSDRCLSQVDLFKHYMFVRENVLANNSQHWYILLSERSYIVAELR
jgi:hypothetical protein